MTSPVVLYKYYHNLRVANKYILWHHMPPPQDYAHRVTKKTYIPEVLDMKQTTVSRVAANIMSSTVMAVTRPEEKKHIHDTMSRRFTPHK